MEPRIIDDDVADNRIALGQKRKKKTITKGKKEI